MIIWPFIWEYEFVLEANQSIQLTKDFSISAKLREIPSPCKFQVDIRIGDKFHNCIQKPWEAAVINLSRKGRIVTVEINGQWKENYYLKTPLVWFPKLK